MKVLVLTTFAVSFLIFGWGLASYFARPDGTPRKMRLLGMIGTTCMLIHLGVLSTSEIHRLEGAAASALYLAAVLVFGRAIRAAGQQRLNVAFTKRTPEFIVRSGPYRWVRHPIYTAYLLAWIAGVVAVQSWVLALTVPVLAALYVNAARAEEAMFARSRYAAEYRAYAGFTGMFFPRLPWNQAGSN